MMNSSLSDSPLSTFVEQQVKDCFYYRQEWLDLITSLYGYSAYVLTTKDNLGQISGFLPLCFMESPLTGRRMVALPFSDHCPLLATDENSANDLIGQAIRLAQLKRVNYLELRTGNNDVLATRSDLVAGNLYVRWVTPLTADPTIIWSRLKTSVRGKIRKSQKLGVQIRKAQCREDMLDFYRLHLQTRSKKHGMPAQPLSFFVALWDNFATNGILQLLLAEHQGIIIAGSILTASGTTIRHAYSASDEHYLHLAPNNLLIWEAIAWACRQGYQIFDHGRTARENEGLMEFKRNWGSLEEPLPYYYYPCNAGLAATPESSLKFRLLTKGWRTLPLWISVPLGNYLYKHLG